MAPEKTEMSRHTEADNQSIRESIASRRAGFGLRREFYRSELIYWADLDRIWRRGWLFAGHSCQIPQPGDYFTMRLENDSLIIVRDDDGSLQALFNVCRHRGTEICDSQNGHVGRFVCPYHQWTYARDGALMSGRGMHEENLDRSELNLFRAPLRQLEGHVFVSFADTPPDFGEAQICMAERMRPQGFERAKVAKIVDYEVAANWTLVWENNRECYHCNANHPQYIKANYDHFNVDNTTPEIRRRMDATITRSQQRWAADGLTVSHRETGMAVFPDADHNLWYAANRTALAEGFVSELMDGKQVAPLMGDYSDPDVGTLRVRTMPNLWNHSSCDHAVTTRLLPAGPQRTLVRVTWLVHEDAVEGRDYQLDEIMPFWQLTSEQDWELCQRAQRGVNSSRFEPGPYSSYKEYNVERFFRWYLRQLAVE